MPRLRFSCAVPIVIFLTVLERPALSQPGTASTPTSAAAASANATPPAPKKRILGIIPNYRTYPLPKVYTPISAREKFKIATKDSFDPGTFVLAAAFAGKGQLANNNPSFGQGMAGYGRYLGTAYADLVIGDYMTEAIYPTLLHQDPRYFRRGTGSTFSRLKYALSQIFWTHNDSGRMGFNYSEVLGNATAVGISNAYYPDSRNVGDNLSKYGVAMGIDMASNVLKEFWPDVSRKMSHKHPTAVPVK